MTNDDGSTAAAPRASRPLGDMMHVAGYARPAAKQAAIVARPQARLEVPAAKTKPSVAATRIAAPAAKPVKTATADPLGPLSGTMAKAKSGAGAKKATNNTTTTKESGSR